jgi:4-amino-4-deoxy-L-arabinose transferase-like glycosyltransferase
VRPRCIGVIRLIRLIVYTEASERQQRQTKRPNEPMTSPETSAFERHYQLIVIVIAVLIFFGTLLSPPSLMDDVDAAHASTARAMLRTGDWTTPRLDGVKYLDKPAGIYWTIAASLAIFGEHDWAARIPLALAAVLLCWLTARMAAWAFSRRAGLYAGVVLGTSVGLFLFTRFLIPEVMLALCSLVALWGFLRLLEGGAPERSESGGDEKRPVLWAVLMGAALGAGLLLKGLIGVVVPGGAGFLYLVLTRQLFSDQTWRHMRPHYVIAVMLLVAAPWYVVAILANPPYFDFTLHSQPGQYRGFFWAFFINEHLLRYLNLRYPRDYNTVPLAYFWLLHLVWLFPWSVYFPAAARLSYRPLWYRPKDRAGRLRLLALCWAGFLLLFFSFSTSQEYYTVPMYPALALLVGAAIAEGGEWVRLTTIVAATLAEIAAMAAGSILFAVRSAPTPGDITRALTQNPSAYTLSMGHMSDLTIESFAYLRWPLFLATVAFLVGGLGAWALAKHGASWLAFALMMVMLTQAAHIARGAFDPMLSSRPLADALVKAPPGRMIIDGAYYPFSSVFFYADRDGLLLNGRITNLEYGSYAPGAPQIFIDNAEARRLWESSARWYLLADDEAFPRLNDTFGAANLHTVLKSGGKALYSNQSIY